jgi:transposase
LTPEQKQAIIAITTSDRAHREKESFQAIKDGDFNEILPDISITTFENVMYEAGYARRKPGWKPSLSPHQQKVRYEWALAHNPDLHEEYDNLGFNYRKVVFTDETPARIGEQRRLLRAWAKDDEIWDDDVRKERREPGTALQFFGAFRYNFKGPCHCYYHETQEEIAAGARALEWENQVTRAQSNSSQSTTRAALDLLREADVNLRRSTRKLQHVKKDDYHRGIRTRGGVDGYRHHEGALKKTVPWIKQLKQQGHECILLEDGAPSHKSRIANDYLTVEQVEKMVWPGHSPEINASEHAWPLMRQHVTKNFPLSRTAEQVQQQWKQAWKDLPIKAINGWVDQIPDVVRRIIRNKGKNNFHVERNTQKSITN